MQHSSTARTPRALALVAVTCGFGFAAAPTPANAQGCQGAPGASALEQYCEAVPRADGGRQRPTSGSPASGSQSSGSGSSSSSALPPKTAKSLDEAGPDGSAVKRLADDGDQPASTSAGSGTGSGGSSSGDEGAVLAERVDSPANPDGSPLRAATNAAQAGPTVGGALVWGLLGLSALGAIGAVFLRRGSSIDPGAGE